MGHVGRHRLIEPLEVVRFDDLAGDDLRYADDGERAPERVFSRHPLLRADHHGLRERDLTHVGTSSFVLAPQVLVEMLLTGLAQGNTPRDVATHDVPTRPVVRRRPFREVAELEEKPFLAHHRHLGRRDRCDCVGESERFFVRPETLLIAHAREVGSQRGCLFGGPLVHFDSF